MTATADGFVPHAIRRRSVRLRRRFLSPLSDGKRIVGIIGPDSGYGQEEVGMSTPHEPGTPEPGGPAASTPEPGNQAAATEALGQRETRRARMGRGVRVVVRHRPLP